MIQRQAVARRITQFNRKRRRLNLIIDAETTRQAFRERRFTRAEVADQLNNFPAAQFRANAFAKIAHLVFGHNFHNHDYKLRAVFREICYNTFMLITIENLIGAPLMSLQTGQPLAQIDSAIIDPRNLKVLAFFCSGPMVDFQPAVIYASDIREFGQMGAIIDSSDKILPLEDLVRLQEILDFGFVLDGIRVVDDHKNKLGKVSDYTIDPESFFIQQLIVAPTLLRSFRIATLTISRHQIKEINNSRIVVKAPTVRSHEPNPNSVELSPQLDNPFRKPKIAPDNSELKS